MNTEMLVKESDVLIVGAGLWGCVVARELAEAGYHVAILESRSLPGGNARSAIDPKTGIECHCYGAHIFHTSDERVWAYANRFATFTDYRHSVLTKHAGKVYSMPLGLALINAFYGTDLTPAEVPAFIAAEVAKAGLQESPKTLKNKPSRLLVVPSTRPLLKDTRKSNGMPIPKTCRPLSFAVFLFARTTTHLTSMTPTKGSLVMVTSPSLRNCWIIPILSFNAIRITLIFVIQFLQKCPFSTVVQLMPTSTTAMANYLGVA